ncbi:MAG: hemolysin family protein [Spirochaetia bacterium]|nr:hemolysin family protein [Spirochaetia bacterium]
MDILFFVLLLIISGILSGSEASLFSINKGRRAGLKKDKSRKAIWITIWIANIDKFLLAILLGNLAVNMFISEIGYNLIGENFQLKQETLTWVSLAIITFVILIFAEILPKVTAINLSEAWLLFWAPVLKFWIFVSAPVTYPILKITRFLLPKSKRTDILKEKDLVEAVKIAEKRGILHTEERRILNRSIAFYNDTAYNAMIPLSKCLMISNSESLQKIKKYFIEEKQPIALVYHKEKGNILGYLHVRTLLLASNKTTQLLKNKIQPILYLPKTMPLKDVMESFITTRNQVAIVVNEAGDFLGLITLREILNLIMGELEEEYTAEVSSPIKEINENLFEISGEISLSEFNDRFKTSFESEKIETISGFLIEKLDGFPAVDTTFQVNNLLFSNMILKDYKINLFYVKISK